MPITALIILQIVQMICWFIVGFSICKIIHIKNEIKILEEMEETTPENLEFQKGQLAVLNKIKL